MPTIRPSNSADVSAIAHIYAHHVNTGTGTFETSPPPPAEMASRREDVLSKNLPYLVLESSSEVIGFAYCNWFKPRPAYRYSAEDSIYLSPAAQGMGFGKLLLTELMAQAERQGIRKLMAVIGDSNNAGSIQLHSRCGFNQVGIVQGCGWKFNRWLDIVLMEKTLGQGQTTAPLDI